MKPQARRGELPKQLVAKKNCTIHPYGRHDDEAKYHREVIDKLQKDEKRLEQRLEAMYVDKLDGKIGERFYEQKSAEWRQDQKDILRQLEEHQDASQSYQSPIWTQVLP